MTGSAPTFSYWRDMSHQDREVDLIVDLGDRIVPFEVKYHVGAPASGKLKGLRLFMQEKNLSQGYAITRRWEDSGSRKPSAHAAPPNKNPFQHTTFRSLRLSPATGFPIKNA